MSEATFIFRVLDRQGAALCAVEARVGARGGPIDVVTTAGRLLRDALPPEPLRAGLRLEVTSGAGRAPIAVVPIETVLDVGLAGSAQAGRVRRRGALHS